ncbi:class I SAM-dependent methyltransferase [Streptomyces europaeiscabiei]|uniref:class I SAM-dependent methyltransferase n=1 Tax=Streptomyces europaeiscabiei TaxID=146819 RepID=UPI0029BE0406|nr:class I SAM-dependent methyltransferase [Streptomyces europaeiscabiei]MDX2764343.1 class I SAM-dependent methyltransferase [Streptomyces europaeiscabiei]
MPQTTETPHGYAAYRRTVAGSFSHWYRRRRDSWTGADTSDAITRFALEQAPTVTGRRPRVLDVGCGRGRQITALTEHLDADSTGLDLLDVWDAPPPARGLLRFRQGDFLDFTGAPLDLVVDNGCLHHQRRADWQAWAAHGAGLLRTGGTLVVSVFLSPDGTVTELPLDDGRLNWWLTEEAVTGLYTGAGLTPKGRLVIDRDFSYRGHRLAYLALAFRKDRQPDPVLKPKRKGNPA